MAVLLLRLAAPMQSWGTQSHFSVRETGLEPSKSGVIGLLCAALGRPRTAAVDDLAALRMGVRVDREGQMMMDYHTAGAGEDGFLRADGKVEKKNVIVSHRYYLADAVFLVGLEGEEALLRHLHEALRAPVWPLYLGRKAFVPGCPVWMQGGLRTDESLEEALERYPWLGSAWQKKPPERLRLMIEEQDGYEIRRDHPVSFDPLRRRYLLRRLRVTFVPRPHVVLEEV